VAVIVALSELSDLTLVCVVPSETLVAVDVPPLTAGVLLDWVKAPLPPHPATIPIMSMIAILFIVLFICFQRLLKTSGVGRPE
jgi:hypothetical protein